MAHFIDWQSQSFSYDVHDNVVTGTNETDCWDNEERLKSITTLTGITDTFTYTQ